MANYVLSCCSTSDLTYQQYIDRDIKFISNHYYLNDVEYKDDFGKTVPYDEFFKKMEEGVVTRTSQTNAAEFAEYFESFLKEGKDIFHLCLSSGITGTVNSANMAAEMLREEYPERKIYILDSLCGASGYGMLMDTLADLKDTGATIDEVYQYAVDNRTKLHHLFFVSDLKYFVRGGRISKSAGLIGSLLHICPLMQMNKVGHLTPIKKVRTKKKVMEEIVNYMIDHVENGFDYDGKVYICHSMIKDDALAIAARIEGLFPKLKQKVQIYNIGTTIGSHTGPGALGLFYVGKERSK